MMEGSFSRLKQQLAQKDLLIQLIVINVAVFFVLGIINVVCTLLTIDSISLIEYIGVSSDPWLMLRRPWTLVSYMFVHEGFWHILFNMIILFAFGRMFLSYFAPRNLGSLYLLGGLAGAMLYLVAFNIVPYYVDMGHSYMIGASASVSAIIFATAFYRPNVEVSFLFIGRIKIIYIALAIFILDFISLSSQSNPGGHVAHIGGAIMGYWYAKQYLKGKDITRWLNNMMDKMVNLFKSKPKKSKMKVKYTKRDADYDYNKRKQNEGETIDKILDKIKSSGYSSLNSDEKKRLFDASKK